jgi:hypothetical protein
MGRGRRGPIALSTPSPPRRRAATGDGVSDTGGIEAGPDVDADVGAAHNRYGQRAEGEYAGGADVDVSESREVPAAEQASTTAAGNCTTSALISAELGRTRHRDRRTPRRGIVVLEGREVWGRDDECVGASAHQTAGIRKQGQICEEGPGRIPVNVRSQKESRNLERTTRNDARCGH